MSSKSRTQFLSILAIAVGMFCLAYASVPLYRIFCRATGFGGTTQIAKTLPNRILDRTVTVRFNAYIDPNLPWEFKPLQKEITMRIGEQKMAYFEATNRTDTSIKGMATYNVTPMKAAVYFNKIQCFCFNQQVLKPHETAKMPVLFFIDPTLADDKEMNDIQTITLSYTFFKVKK